MLFRSDATYHWTFTGAEGVIATIVIRDKKIHVAPGHAGKADVAIHADAKTWLAILNRDYAMVPAIVLRKVRVKGSMKLFRAFGGCVPG